MTKSKFVLAVLAIVACTTASAQVYRCPDKATGRLTYSDAPCMDGRQIERKRSDEDRILDAERAFDSRVRFSNEQRRERAEPSQQPARQQQQAATPGIPPASRHECEVAQKNAWGTNKEQAQKKADILCYGSEKAATMQIERDRRAAAESMGKTSSRADSSRSSSGTPNPTSITNCRGGFCQDNTGGTYFKQGNDFMTGTNGRPCFRQGNQWNCQ